MAQAPHLRREPHAGAAAAPGPSAPGASPAPARICDYLLGGQHYYAADAQAAQRIMAIVPEIGDTVWSNRGFHQRAATWIARQGVRQFLDIGAGLPTLGNTHEVARRVHPGARVVYVDSDPVVELHASQILQGDAGAGVICADLREPEAILGHPRYRELIRPDEPTGLMMTGVMMFIPDDAAPLELVARYAGQLAPGSWLALSHLTADAKPPAAVAGFRAVFDDATQRLYFRSAQEIRKFFAGLEMVPPYEGAAADISYCGVWGAEDAALADSEGSRWLYCGVGMRR
jgi:O-methyltransferase involved in polyketide biosynthesis